MPLPTKEEARQLLEQHVTDDYQRHHARMVRSCRPFIASATLLIALVVFLVSTATAAIDRQALVTRHNVELRQFDPQNPLQVGNGEFAFAVDATGLQSFQSGLGT